MEQQPQPQIQPPVQVAKVAKAPKAGSVGVIATPMYLSIIRGLQFLFSIITIGMAGYILHYVYMDSLGFAVVCVRFYSPVLAALSVPGMPPD